MVTMFKGDGFYDFDIVGEMSYQTALKRIAGPKTKSGHDHRCLGALMLNDENRYDPLAVAVFLLPTFPGDGVLVGFLSRGEARSFRNRVACLPIDPKQLMLVRATICGGWDSFAKDEDDALFPRDEWEERSVGHYGVKLDLAIPLALDAEWATIGLVKVPPTGLPPVGGDG